MKQTWIKFDRFDKKIYHNVVTFSKIKKHSMSIKLPEHL